MDTNPEILELLDEATEIELNAARLYRDFARAFPEDAVFWRQLPGEEHRHAATLRSLRESFVPAGIFPESFLLSSLAELKASNQSLREQLDDVSRFPKTRGEAIRTALGVAQRGGDFCFQSFVGSTGGTRIDQVFRALNEADAQHAKRIAAYAEECGIPL